MLIYLVGLVYWMCLFFDLLRRCVCVVLGVAYLVGFSCEVAMLLLVGVCKFALGGVVVGCGFVIGLLRPFMVDCLSGFGIWLDGTWCFCFVDCVYLLLFNLRCLRLRF